MLPRKYFAVKGKGLSRTSPLLAFNSALRDAGIHHLNLVPVSSILPSDAVEESYRRLPPGSIVFAVISETRSKGPARLSAGLSWARGVPHGYIIEIHGNFSAEKMVQEMQKMWAELRETEDVVLETPRFLVEELRVPEGFYGCVIAAVIFSEVSLACLSDSSQATHDH